MALENNLVEIVTPMPDDSERTRAVAALDQVKALVINSPETYVAAAAGLATVKGQFKAVDQQREDLKAPSLEGCRRVDAFFKPALDFLREAETIYKGKLTTYDREQDRIRREEQRKADEIARKERERLAAIARETERKAQEKAAAERKAAEEAAAAGRAEEAARLREKAQATEQKAAEKAATFDERAATTVAPVISRAPPKVAGLSFRDNWRFEITDAAKINAAFLTPDTVKIGAQVKALKGDAAAIIGPGVRVWCEKVPASSAA